MILNKNRSSHTIKKPESVGEKRVQYFCIVPSEISLQVSIFALILDKFCLQNLITSLKVVRFTLYDPQ